MNKVAASNASALPPVISFDCQVTNVTPLSANTHLAELKAPEDVTLDYLAGHYLKLDLDVNGDGKAVSLFYSIANSYDPKHPHRLQLFVQNTSDFTDKILKHLYELNEQTKSNAATNVSVTLPMGKSYLQTDLNAPHLLIAAGSGIAKIKCLAESIVKQNPSANVQLYWSNRSEDEFYLLDDLHKLAADHKNLTFTPILEAPNPEWSGRTGYIYKVVQEDFTNLDSAKLYLCGSPQMVYGTIDQLKTNGAMEENCYSDAFEYAPRD